MKILVGYDGSNAAKDALEVAIDHAKAFGLDIAVLTSLQGGTVTHDVEVDHARQYLEEAENRVRDAGVGCETHLMIRGMTPGEDLVTFAKEHPTKQIVVGVKRRSKVGKLLFGSNAQYVIVNAPCPVVTVR